MTYTIEAEHNRLISLDASGRLEPDSIAKGAAQLLEVTSEETPTCLLVRFQHMELGKLASIASKWSRSREFLALQKRLAKVAVLSDQSWIRHSVVMQSATLQEIAVKPFDLDDEADARMWLENSEEAIPA